MTDLYTRPLPRTDKRLGRTIVHDPRSRGFVRPGAVDQSTWRRHLIRVYDPRPNPNQTVGNCTTCSKSSQLNAAGNRKTGVVLGMSNALTMYEYETTIDPFPGYFKRGDPNSTDTGSNGLSSCKTAQYFGIGGEYVWIFSGADGVVQAIMDGDVVSCGTAWYDGMFNRDKNLVIQPTGALAGGHQWIARGYDPDTDMVLGRCWWGTYRDFWIKRAHLAELLADDGDAHVQSRA